MQHPKLNILHINKFHYLRGGSEVVYLGTSNLLESHGNSSVFFSMHYEKNLPCKTSDCFVLYVDGDLNSIVYFGRLSAKKGLWTLLEATVKSEGLQKPLSIIMKDNPQ